MSAAVFQGQNLRGAPRCNAPALAGYFSRGSPIAPLQ
jgi:hypothetical protein